MVARTLSSPPSILPLYVRAAASLLPGASLLPFVPGGGGEIHEAALVLTRVRPDRDRLDAYAGLCGFSLGEHLPPTYPHVLAFPLHMAIMADGKFPLGAIGLVHVENRILQQRPIAVGEELEIRVRATQLQPHPRGRSFTLVSDVSAGGESVWRGISTILRRGGGTGERRAQTKAQSTLAPGAEWRLAGDLGRRYAAVSGDRNPIHMHALLARPLGFPRAIAHGMWTKARCLAELGERLPDAFSVDVRFRKPILLPARVRFASAQHGERIELAVHDAERPVAHLEGHVRPLQENERAGGADG